MKKPADNPEASKPRRLSEKMLIDTAEDGDNLSEKSPEDIASLIHELRVHQIELEMQNEELARIQGELEKTRDRYSHLYDFAPVGYFTLTEKGIITEANLTFASMLGAERSGLTGKPLTHFVLKDDQDIYYQHQQRLMETEAPHKCDLRFVKKDAHEFYARLECMVINNKDDDLKQIRAVVSDISESKRFEEEILKAQKLESIGVLAGGIAHDFNNILTTILGNMSLARMQTRPGDEVFELLREAEIALTRAQALTKQLLTFAKGGAPLKETASIKHMIEESCSFVLRGSKSSYEFSIVKDLWPAEVDNGQISQVINNIVINANQAMPEGGIIRIAAENLILEENPGLPLKPGRYIRVTIKDQGVGIAEKHLSNVFDPYFTTKQEGSGLGLATSFSIIKKHDGHITVESQLGVGTTFQIYLPASDRPVPEKEEAQVIKGKGRILVMDDEASLRKMVGKMLGKLGYESESAKDGAEAIRMVKEAKETEKTYDAVILDLTVPGGMGGKECVKKLLEIDPEVKAIVSSGYSEDPVLANYQNYGFKGVMPKPFESHSLGKVLHEALRGQKE